MAYQYEIQREPKKDEDTDQTLLGAFLPSNMRQQIDNLNDNKVVMLDPSKFTMHERTDVGTGIISNGNISSNTIMSEDNIDNDNNNTSTSKNNSLVGCMSIDRWVCKVDSPTNHKNSTTSNSNSNEEIRYFLFSHQSGFSVLNKAFKCTRTQALQLLEKGIKSN